MITGVYLAFAKGLDHGECEPAVGSGVEPWWGQLKLEAFCPFSYKIGATS